MDNATAKNLAKLLLDLHSNNALKISSNSALSKYRFLSQSQAVRFGSKIFFSDESRQRIQPVFENFFLRPQSQTPYLIADVDMRCGWVKLLRFVTTDWGDINAEAVFLMGNTVADLQGFGYRYEHPEKFRDESPNKPNKHAFFHVQPIKNTSTGVPLPVRPPWLPDYFPTFFIFASCAYELVLYAIHSLSGWELMQKYWSDTRDPNPVLARLVMVGEKASTPFPASA